MGGRWLVLAGWAAASGCVVSVGDKPATPPPPPAAAASQPPPPREFASMRPGDYVPAHPELLAADPPPRPADPPPLTSPSLKPASAAEPAPPDSPLVAAVRHLEAGRRPDAEVALAALPAGASALPLLAAAVQAAGKGGAGGASEAVRVLEGAAAGLAPRAQLEITKAVFCNNVRGFGQYDPLPTDRPTYPKGKQWTVWVYLELRNVVPQPAGPDGYLPRLTGSLVVHDAAGAVVYQKAGPPEREPLRSPTRDNHIGFHFAAPERPGGYTVTLQVQEPAADGKGVARTASRVLRFDVR